MLYGQKYLQLVTDAGIIESFLCLIRIYILQQNRVIRCY